MKTSEELKQLLMVLNRKSYPAYKETKGAYRFPEYSCSIEHVQGDPFAAPSRVSISVDGRKAGFPVSSYDQYHKRIALQDYLIRLFAARVEKYNFRAKGSGKSGLIAVSRCGQEILERTACTIDEKTGSLLIRMEIGFPANGRTINSTELIKILFDFLPVCVAETCFYGRYKAQSKLEIEEVRKLAEDQEAVRRQLPDLGLTAFVANGSILPRESGVSGYPMRIAVKFQAPSSMEVTLELPNRGQVKGMGIPRGVILIVGGGYHGKSTLLKALELGVYNHISGDGRELVITDASALKLRAEDGRSIRNVNISMFINHLPNGKDTVNFCTEDASGSTSQAAGVIEGLEAGSTLFLVDEDTSATNFMIRDELMQRVVSRDKEPITPFIERVRQLYEQFGISTIIVAGSSGAYFHVADQVIQMDRYIPADITERAKDVASAFPGPAVRPEEGKLPDFLRKPVQTSVFRSCDRMKIKTGRDSITIDRELIDLRYVEQLTDQEQLCALGYLLKYAQMNLMDGKKPLRQIVDLLEQEIRKHGLASIADNGYLPVDLALPRRQEIFACINRYRQLEF